METIRSTTIFPQRLTQLFADTKKSYENVVQTRHEGPELSSLHRKLRIQKDRLLAWGLEWSDANAAQAVDIDGSLDRAGISDLVASIMSSIRELLDEAEGLQPSRTFDSPSPYGDVKIGGKSSLNSAWTSASIKRLEGILEDLTASIDTLCDLSRPRVEDWKKRDHHVPDDGGNGKAAFKSGRASMELGIIELAPPMDRSEKSSESQIYDLITASRIKDGCIRQKRTNSSQRDSQPPSYESVAAGSEHRLLAWLCGSDLSTKLGKAGSSRVDEVPVLLDYGQSHRHEALSDIIPDCVRYDELFFALQKLSSDEDAAYHGVLRLRGWFPDPMRLQCAYVYELPRPEGQSETFSGLQPRSLLSFLQNGADADGANIPPLENRYRLAYNIASTVSRLHSAGVAHGNLNSNNILYFVDGKSTNEKIWKGHILRKPHLAGFHQSTLTVTTAEQVSDFSGIYHHPSINSQSSAYTLAHEFYSIGLILLEIGLWMPLGKFRKVKYSLEDFKARLRDVYVKKLSAKCGNHYMRAALYCMTVADEVTQNYLPRKGTELPMREPSEYEAEFRLKVLKPLQHCCKLDESADEADDQQFAQLSRDHGYGQSPLQQDSPITPCQPSSLAGVSSNAIPQIMEASAPTKSNPTPRKRQGSKRKIRVWSHEIPSLYTKYWTSIMFPKLERILSKAISRWESYTIDLFMAGEDADTARPTIYLECTSTEKVRRILKHLNKDLRLFNIKVVSGEIVRSKAGKKKRKKTQKGARAPNSDAVVRGDGAFDQQRLNPHYQPVPSCGASIGAYNNGKHYPPVTFGGTILVDGETYGMSVHHMLEDDEELELGLGQLPDLRRSMASRQPLQLNETRLHQVSISQEQASSLYPFEMAGGADDDDVSSEGYGSEFSNNAETVDGVVDEFSYPFDISEDEDDFNENRQENMEEDFWLSPDFDRQLQLEADEDSDDDIDLGDTLGVKVDHGHDMAVTQPAIDDVNEEFFSTEEAKNEEHLSSHAFGHIHASSGIKRSRKDDIIHEIDWALINIKESRAQAQNIVQGGACYFKSSLSAESRNENISTSHSYPRGVMSATNLGGLQVHAFGRTSGLQSGTILPNMRMVKMPGRCFASHSWHVKGNFGGD